LGKKCRGVKEETKHGRGEGEKEEAESPSERDVGADHMLWES